MQERRARTLTDEDLNALAWSHGGWGSWHDIQVSLVRMFTQSEYSHVGLALVGAGRVFVLEAVGAGVRNLQWLPNEIKSCKGAKCKDRWEREVYR